MKWSFPLGRIAGIDVRVHATFFLIVIWVAASHLALERSLASAAAGTAFLLAIFVCVLLHELGHALAARRYGIGTKDITLLPIGGLARLERMPDRPGQELVVALAGPAVNVGLAGACAAWLAVSAAFVPLSDVGPAAGPFVERLLVANLFLAAFNLIPAFPMDGGRVLRALLAMRLGPVRATRFAAGVARGLAVLMGLAGLAYNPFLVLIAVFVWFGAGQEERSTVLRQALSGVRAGDAMIVRFTSLDASSPVALAREQVRAGFQDVFPVESEGRPVGVIGLEDLEHANPFVSVRDVMRAPVPVLEENDSLASLLEGPEMFEEGLAIVVRAGRTVGLVPLDRLPARVNAALRRAG